MGKKSGNDLQVKGKSDKQDGRLSCKKETVQLSGTGMVAVFDDIPSCGLEEKSVKRRKKQKKQKLKIDMPLEILERISDGEKDTIYRGRYQVKANKDMPANSFDLAKGSDIHKKRKKAKKKTYDCERLANKVGEKTEGKDGLTIDISTSSGGVNEKSGDCKETKQVKNWKHESNLLSDKKEDAKSREKQVNTHVNNTTSNDMPPSNCDVAEASSSHRKKGERKKTKRKSSVLSENMVVKAEGKAKNVYSDAKNRFRDILPSGSCDVTEMLGSQIETKEIKKRKYESDLSPEKLVEETEGKGEYVRADVNEVPLSSCNISGESAGHKRLKKAVKIEQERDSLSEETKMKDKDVSIALYDKICNRMPPSNRDVTDDWSINKPKRKRKEKKHELFEEKHDNISNIMLLSNRGVSEESSSHKKGKKVKKRTHESGLLSEKLKGNAQDGQKEVTLTLKDRLTNDGNTNRCEVTEQFSSHKKGKKAKKHKHSIEILSKNKEEEKEESGSQWANAEFSNVERKEKFLRLMGAFKPSTKHRETSNYSAMAMGKQQEKAFVCSLEKQYSQALHRGKGKGLGLGYQ